MNEKAVWIKQMWVVQQRLDLGTLPCRWNNVALVLRGVANVGIFNFGDHSNKVHSLARLVDVPNTYPRTPLYVPAA